MPAQPPVVDESGFLLPAEWERHRATWLAWPLHPDWGEYLDGARRATEQLARAIVGRGGHHEHVHLLVAPEIDAASMPTALGEASAGAVTWHRVEYGDVWLRDTGPLFVYRGQEIAATCFAFNGWGRKYIYPGDAAVAATIAKLSSCPRRQFDFVLEGGAIEGDGNGTIITTRQCLLGGHRNPGLDEADYEQLLRTSVGARRLLWLDDGLLNDHTDGHVDTLVRFVGPGKVVCMEPAGPSDPNRETLLRIESQLRQFRDADGNRLDVVAVPSPGHVAAPGHELLPASYLNFYVANRSVAVPVYGSPNDEEAVKLISELFQGRDVVPIDSVPLVTAGGALHCISQQQPEVRKQ